MSSPGHRCSGAGAGYAVQAELFERPPFSPIWPVRATKAERALERLLAGQKITHHDFIASGDGWRLAAYIHELKENLGWWPIDAEDISAPSANCSNRTIARYFLPRWAIETIRAAHG